MRQQKSDFWFCFGLARLFWRGRGEHEIVEVALRLTTDEERSNRGIATVQYPPGFFVDIAPNY